MKTFRVQSPLPASLALLIVIVQPAGADYQSTVLSDGPRAYYRLNDNTGRSLIHTNLGSLGAAGNAVNDLMTFKSGPGTIGTNTAGTGVVHPFPGAIAGDGDRSEFFDFTTRTEIPWNAAFNTPANQPFTVEAWLYPASDQTGTGQAPIVNRYTVGANRQGWVFFQRRPDPSYTPGDQGLGWNFRVFNGSGGSSPLDTQTDLSPYQVGKWQHVVVVYDPVYDAVLVTNATVTMYIDGLPAKTNTVVNAAGVYQPCTGDHDTVTESPTGQPALSIGCYNNANTGLNPYFGAVDEFAWYSNKLSPAQILAHYQNATNANRVQSYDSLIKSHNPVVYLRLDEIAPGADVAVNLGDVRAAGIATHGVDVRHPAGSALVGRSDDGASGYHIRNSSGGGVSTTTMPYIPANNPNAGVPFTFEAWFRPMRDQQGGQSPVNNRMVGGTGRTGWVIYQRNPNLSYPASEGHGWNFRMYSGSGSGGQDVLTDTDYSIGKWQHLVFTWEPQIDNGDLGNGNDQWQGILTAYVDGVAVASNTAARYAANRQVPEPGQNNDVPADLAVGSYNAASGLGNDPYEGDVDELAFYNNIVLTPDQILAHYQAGTNSHAGTNYETLVFTAGLNTQNGGLSAGRERTGLPSTYLRFNDAARYPAANSGALGYVADGNLILTTNTAAGPQSPTYAGFEASNAALPLDGLKQWASLNNPVDLNISGQITLEAWIKPDATQSDPARIISHGPPTVSDFLGATTVPDNSVTNSAQVFLRIDGAGANYVVGSTAITYTNNVDISSNFYGASFAIPGGDLGGGNWIHLVGTCDGANWKLYRNGAQVASSAAVSGALPVSNGDWAIGATGNGWANNYAGGIDEVAIYSTALSARQIATHYLMGKAGTTAITIAKSGTSVTITWPAGTTLQEAASVTGTFTDVAGSPGSPLTIPAAGTKFYRWRL